MPESGGGTFTHSLLTRCPHYHLTSDLDPWPWEIIMALEQVPHNSGNKVTIFSDWIWHSEVRVFLQMIYNSCPKFVCKGELYGMSFVSSELDLGFTVIITGFSAVSCYVAIYNWTRVCQGWFTVCKLSQILNLLLIQWQTSTMAAPFIEV